MSVLHTIVVLLVNGFLASLAFLLSSLQYVVLVGLCLVFARFEIAAAAEERRGILPEEKTL
jgi:uncharacterized membrane protein YccF (DUF307 family)